MPSLVPEQEPICPLTCPLTPLQEAALLKLNRTHELSVLVWRKLYASTMRPTAADMQALVDCRLAVRTRGGIKITFFGVARASPLALSWAKALDVSIPKFASHRRGGFRRGHLSQSGNW